MFGKWAQPNYNSVVATLFEVLNHYCEGIDASDVLARLGLSEHQFFVVSAHREENVDSDRNFLKLVDVLNIVAEQ